MAITGVFFISNLINRKEGDNEKETDNSNCGGRFVYWIANRGGEYLTKNRGKSYIPYGRNWCRPGRGLDIHVVDGVEKEDQNIP